MGFTFDPQGAKYFSDLSGANTQALGRGIGQAEAPILMDAYNRANADRLAAITGQYGAGNTTSGILSGLDQTKLGNMQAGIGGVVTFRSE